MGVAGQPPIITHTAATPQDSPNTTLNVGYRDLNYRAVYPAAALSIESIDRSGVRFYFNNRLTVAGQESFCCDWYNDVCVFISKNRKFIRLRYQSEN